MCGEHNAFGAWKVEKRGSSPRVRGTLSHPLLAAGGVGIIPACAGNTVIAGFGVGGHWDHPRVCGEHTSLSSGLISVMGSSPRVRGTLHRIERQGAGRGIIPACAGNTRTWDAAARPSRDHPRVCGEHLNCEREPVHTRGSSPRVRGTRSTAFPMNSMLGIIPACAGNTAQPYGRNTL